MENTTDTIEKPRLRGTGEGHFYGGTGDVEGRIFCNNGCGSWMRPLGVMRAEYGTETTNSSPDEPCPQAGA